MIPKTYRLWMGTSLARDVLSLALREWSPLRQCDRDLEDLDNIFSVDTRQRKPLATRLKNDLGAYKTSFLSFRVKPLKSGPPQRWRPKAPQRLATGTQPTASCGLPKVRN